MNERVNPVDCPTDHCGIGNIAHQKIINARRRRQVKAAHEMTPRLEFPDRRLADSSGGAGD